MECFLPSALAFVDVQIEGCEELRCDLTGLEQGREFLLDFMPRQALLLLRIHDPAIHGNQAFEIERWRTTAPAAMGAGRSLEQSQTVKVDHEAAPLDVLLGTEADGDARITVRASDPGWAVTRSVSLRSASLQLLEFPLRSLCAFELKLHALPFGSTNQGAVRLAPASQDPMNPSGQWMSQPWIQHLDSSSRAAFLVCSNGGKPYSAELFSLQVPLLRLESGDSALFPCEQSSVDVRPVDELVGLVLLASSGTVEEQTAFSVALPSWQEFRSASANPRSVLLKKKELASASELAVKVGGGGVQTIRVEDLTRISDQVLGIFLPVTHPAGEIRICPATEVPTLAQRPNAIAVQRGFWAVGQRVFHASWSECAVISDLPTGTFELKWAWGKSGRRRIETAEITSRAPHVQRVESVPLIQEVGLIVTDWGALPSSLRPVRIRWEGLLVDLVEGRGKLLAALPSLPSTTCEIENAIGQIAEVPAIASYDAQRQVLSIRLALESIEIATLSIPAVAGGRIQAEAWDVLPDKLGGSRPFGALHTAPKGGDLSILRNGSSSLSLLVREFSDKGSLVRGILTLSDTSAQVETSLPGEWINLDPLSQAHSQPSAELMMILLDPTNGKEVAISVTRHQGPAGAQVWVPRGALRLECWLSSSLIAEWPLSAR